MKRHVAAAVAVVLAAGALPACGLDGDPLRIGGIYPLSGVQAIGADELGGLQTAAQLVNAAGGVRGRRVEVDGENAVDALHASASVDRLARRGARVIVGTHASAQAVAASAEAARAGLVFVETGALADLVTARGLPGVLRTGVSGAQVGRMAADFVKQALVPGARVPAAPRVEVVAENDSYGASVMAGAIEECARLNLDVVDTISYDVRGADYDSIAGLIARDQADVVITAPYQEDAVALRKAIASRAPGVKAIVGASSSYSAPAFAAALGPQAAGLFAVDKPDIGFNVAALDPAARALLARAQQAYSARFKRAMSYAAVEGFVGGWVMLHDVLPKAAGYSRPEIWSAAKSLDLPSGTEIDASGVRFAGDGDAEAGQNLRAAAVVWQWLDARTRVIVYPPPMAQTAPQAISLTS